MNHIANQQVRSGAAEAIRRMLLAKAPTNAWARGVPRLFRKDRIEDLTEGELLEVQDEILAGAARADEHASIRARMESAICGCPVRAAQVAHLSMCSLEQARALICTQRRST